MLTCVALGRVMHHSILQHRSAITCMGPHFINASTAARVLTSLAPNKHTLKLPSARSRSLRAKESSTHQVCPSAQHQHTRPACQHTSNHDCGRCCCIHTVVVGVFTLSRQLVDNLHYDQVQLLGKTHRYCVQMHADRGNGLQAQLNQLSMPTQPLTCCNHCKSVMSSM